jgi:hypothetical protein
MRRSCRRCLCAFSCARFRFITTAVACQGPCQAWTPRALQSLATSQQCPVYATAALAVSGITYACVGGRASQNILTYVCVYRLRNGGTQLHSPTGLVSSVAWFLVSTQPPRCGQTTLGNLAVSPSSCIRLRPENLSAYAVVCARGTCCSHGQPRGGQQTRELCFQGQRSYMQA